MMGEVIRVSGRAPDIGDFLREAMVSQKFADVALCCTGGQRFFAHRLVLSAASSYLQEVLVAHSQVAGYCEPITVILAEVEGSELAALLGFVYTGSATVPRPRLDAFLRAAEALHIRLPPLPGVLKNCLEDCKPEDFKDVKISTPYLQCEQYPSSWFWNGSTKLLQNAQIKGTQHHDWTKTHSENSHANYAGISNKQPDKIRPSTEVSKSYWERNSTDFREYGQTWTERPCRPDFGIAEDYSSSKMLISNPASPKSSIEYSEDFHEETRKSAFRQSNTNYWSVYGSPRNGEDLTCRESCCKWRTTRRHVANQVTASPWKQLERPHHSPKMNPNIQWPVELADQRGPDIPLPSQPLHSQNSISPRNSGRCSVTPSENFYQVPNENLEKRLESQVEQYKEIINTTEGDVRVDTECQIQDFGNIHRVPSTNLESSNGTSIIINDISNSVSPRISSRNPYSVPMCSTSQMSSSTIVTKRNLMEETYEQQSPGLSPRNHPQDERKFGKAQTTKPELSHPVSRLCDSASVRTIEPIVLPTKSIVDPVKVEDADGVIYEKNTGAQFQLLSDNNNNNNNNNDDDSNLVSANQRTRNGGQSVDHQCDQCGKTFVTRASLKVHSRTHTGEKPFRCTDCGKQFSQLRNYKYHRSVHEGTREFAATCPECGKYFNDRGYLSSHMKIHRNRKEYACTECGKSFNQRVAYNMHVRIHTGIKPHQCEQCGKAFSRKMLLKQHLRTHSGERPYQCQVCHKAFADRSNMTLHTRLHSGLKPYQCTLCSKAFTKKHHLKTHLNYHTGTKPYSCPKCGLRFSQSSNMRTHFKKCTINNTTDLPAENPSEEQKSKTESSLNKLVLSLQTVEAGMTRNPAVALTPPNSDQESSVLTPISRTLPFQMSGKT